VNKNAPLENFNFLFNRGINGVDKITILVTGDDEWGGGGIKELKMAINNCLYP
jgi:hypothetical protein